MNETMHKFTEGQITDKAFLESIRVLNFGIQYVAKTTAVCSKISIIQEKELHGIELIDAVQKSIAQRKQGNQMAKDIQQKYRREGLFFDEILDNIRENTHKEKGR